jgi:hypothetical protein
MEKVIWRIKNPRVSITWSLRLALSPSAYLLMDPTPQQQKSMVTPTRILAKTTFSIKFDVLA